MLEQNFPDNVAALITFNGEVTIYGDGVSVPAETLAGDHLDDFDAIWKKGLKYDGKPRKYIQIWKSYLSFLLQDVRRQCRKARRP